MECAMVGILSRFHSIFMTVRHMSWNIHRRAPPGITHFHSDFTFINTTGLCCLSNNNQPTASGPIATSK